MSLDEPQQQSLDSIEDSLAGSDPGLASMLNIFSRLTADEQMPIRDKIPAPRERPAGRRVRRPRRNQRTDMAIPHARPLYPRLGSQRAMLVLSVVMFTGLLAVALVLSTSGHKGCIQSIGTTCPSPSPHSMPTHPTR